jgi:hypothetical protein
MLRRRRVSEAVSIHSLLVSVIEINNGRIIHAFEFELEFEFVELVAISCNDLEITVSKS